MKRAKLLLNRLNVYCEPWLPTDPQTDDKCCFFSDGNVLPNDCTTLEEQITKCVVVIIQY